MNTLCLTTNLSSSDVAAWAQFAAAVLGALTTIGVAYWAGHAQERQSSAANRMLAVQLIFVLGEIKDACESNDEAKLKSEFLLLKEVGIALRGLPMHTLPLTKMYLHAERLKITAKAIDRLEEWEINGLPFLENTIKDTLTPTFEKLRLEARNTAQLE